MSPSTQEKRVLERGLQNAVKDEQAGSADYTDLSQLKGLTKGERRVLRSHARDERRHEKEDRKVLKAVERRARE